MPLFVNFDVEIWQNLLTDAISYAKSLIEKTEEEYSTIMHSRKRLLFQNSRPWAKKDGNGNFDVFIGCYDGAEACELEGSFILNQEGPVIDKNDIGFDWDDGL